MNSANVIYYTGTKGFENLYLKKALLYSQGLREGTYTEGEIFHPINDRKMGLKRYRDKMMRTAALWDKYNPES